MLLSGCRDSGEVGLVGPEPKSALELYVLNYGFLPMSSQTCLLPLPRSLCGSTQALFQAPEFLLLSLLSPSLPHSPKTLHCPEILC